MTFISDKSGLTVTDEPVYRSNRGVIQLIGKKLNFNLNSTSDQQIPLSGSGSKFIVTDIVITNASQAPLAAADLEFASAPSGGGIYVADTWSIQGGYAGTSIVGIGVNGLLKLTSSSKYISSMGINSTNSLADSPFINIYNKTDIITSLYGKLGTPEGVALTVDVYVMGYCIG